MALLVMHKLKNHHLVRFKTSSEPCMKLRFLFEKEVVNDNRTSRLHRWTSLHKCYYHCKFNYTDDVKIQNQNTVNICNTSL